MALINPPLCHGDGRAERFNHLLLRIDLTFATHRGTQLCDRGFEPLHPGGRRAEIGSLLVNELLGCGVILDQDFVALKIGLDLVARGSGIGEVRLGLLDFGRLGAGL